MLECMGEGNLQMKYRSAYHDLTLNSVVSVGQVGWGEHNGSTEIEHEVQQKAWYWGVFLLTYLMPACC